jgi:hypothetical protein
MNNFFKMSLVAAAVALSGTATAGTFTGNNTVAGDITANENALVFSTEGLAVGTTAAALQAGPVISYKLGAAYIIGDQLTITFANAMDAAKSVLPTTIMVDTAEFNLISSSTLTVVYRVVSGTAQAGSVFVLPQNKATAADLSDSAKSGLVFTGTNLVGNTVTASATKNNGSVVHDVDTTTTASSASSRILALSATQFGTSKVTQKFNAVVDDTAATNPSTKFVAGTDDSMTVTYTAPKVMPTKALLGMNDGVNDLTASKVAPVMTVLATLPIADIAKYTIASASGTVATAANGTTAANADITVTYPTGTTVPNDTLTITPKTGATAPTMAAYTFDASIASNGATVLATAASNAGVWAVTGSDTVEIPYMPYGTGLSQVVYATNKSVSDVEVSAKGTDEAGTVYNLGVIGVANASSVTKLSTDLKNGFAAKGFTDGKLAIVLTFRGNSADVTAGTIQVQSGYNANASDRGFVSNTSNGSK